MEMPKIELDNQIKEELKRLREDIQKKLDEILENQLKNAKTEIEKEMSRKVHDDVEKTSLAIIEEFENDPLSGFVAMMDFLESSRKFIEEYEKYHCPSELGFKDYGREVGCKINMPCRVCWTKAKKDNVSPIGTNLSEK